VSSYPISVVGSAVALGELTGADTDAVHAIYGDPRATEHLSFDPRSREQVELIVARSIVSARQEPRVEYALAIRQVPTSGEPLVGFARLAVEPHQSGTIGFALHPDFWGRGLGREAVRLLLVLAFDRLGLHRVWAARAPDNIASDRVLRTAGMPVEGRIRHHVHTHGAWRDSITHAILSDEWPVPNDVLSNRSAAPSE
jgi:RimJ/RimL family protein N-acetyltransferase